MLHRLGMTNQPLYFLNDKNFKDLLKRQKKDSKIALSEYVRDKKEEKKNPSTAFKPQPSSLPERQNPDEVKEIVIRPNVVMANWNSVLAQAFIECEGPIRGLELRIHRVLSANAQKILDDFNAGKVSALRKDIYVFVFVTVCVCVCVCMCLCMWLCWCLCVAVFLYLLLLHTVLLLRPRHPTTSLTYSFPIPSSFPSYLFYNSFYHHVSSFSSFYFLPSHLSPLLPDLLSSLLPFYHLFYLISSSPLVTLSSLSDTSRLMS